MTRVAIRLFTALVMLYFGFDVTAPHLPGAFEFDVESSVEVTRPEHLGDAPRLLADEPERAVMPSPVAVISLPRVRRPARITGDGRTHHRALARSAPARPVSEDA